MTCCPPKSDQKRQGLNRLYSISKRASIFSKAVVGEVSTFTYLPGDWRRFRLNDSVYIISIFKTNCAAIRYSSNYCHSESFLAVQTADTVVSVELRRHLLNANITCRWYPIDLHEFLMNWRALYISSDHCFLFRKARPVFHIFCTWIPDFC